MVGTRRRYDTRLLLAHLARLDRLVSENVRAAEVTAGRFDELLAVIAGEVSTISPRRVPIRSLPEPEVLAGEAADRAVQTVEDAWAGKRTRTGSR